MASKPNSPRTNKTKTKTETNQQRNEQKQTSNEQRSKNGPPNQKIQTRFSRKWFRKWGQEEQSGPKMEPRGAKTRSRSHKMAQDGPRQRRRAAQEAQPGLSRTAGAPKWRPKSTKIDEKVVSTGLSKNVPHFDCICCCFFVKRPMTTKHNKYQYKTMIFALPRNAPRFTKKVKKRSKHHPKIL